MISLLHDGEVIPRPCSRSSVEANSESPDKESSQSSGESYEERDTVVQVRGNRHQTSLIAEGAESRVVQADAVGLITRIW